MAFSFDLRVYLLCDCRNLFLGFEWWQLKAIPSVLFGVNTGLTRARRLKHHPPVVFFRKRIQKDISAIHTVNNMNTDKKSSEIHISIRCLIKIAFASRSTGTSKQNIVLSHGIFLQEPQPVKRAQSPCMYESHHQYQ